MLKRNSVILLILTTSFCYAKEVSKQYLMSQCTEKNTTLVSGTTFALPLINTPNHKMFNSAGGVITCNSGSADGAEICNNRGRDISVVISTVDNALKQDIDLNYRGNVNFFACGEAFCDVHRNPICGLHFVHQKTIQHTKRKYGYVAVDTGLINSESIKKSKLDRLKHFILDVNLNQNHDPDFEYYKSNCDLFQGLNIHNFWKKKFDKEGCRSLLRSYTNHGFNNNNYNNIDPQTITITTVAQNAIDTTDEDPTYRVVSE